MLFAVHTATHTYLGYIAVSGDVVSLQLEGSMKFGGNAELEPDTPDGKLMDLDSISSTQLARHVSSVMTWLVSVQITIMYIVQITPLTKLSSPN